MADRQRIIETNRSLRLIKNELESLLEKGVITDDAFDTFHRLLPAEAPLAGHSATHTPASRTASTASPAPTSPAAAPVPPTAGLSNLSLNSGGNANNNAPPSYTQSASPAPPSGPPPPPSKPVLAHARALYRYAAADARDCSFERDDRIAVHEYMNADWWMGRNLRTGQEGIFPKNYVELEAAPPPGPPPGMMMTPAGGAGYPDEKAGYNGYQAPGQPTYGGYPPAPPPGQQNPYNSSVPPMAVAEQGSSGGEQHGNGKVGEYGKKFGKKLGNAAIFGAGATIGGNIVNSIF
ncbi:SH3 domain containing protein [Pleurostoma richardsiae]|uniref:SH3 domain containing protein n=1 Tax=Pleurostoma richardsiae TaxID=41990 RepID=A0AA38S336_9PEZI|nr:SH3 domain containing protein [Pleurostoma richardsiae]